MGGGGLIAILLSLAHAVCNERLVKEDKYIRAIARKFTLRTNYALKRRGMTEDDVAQELFLAAWEAHIDETRPEHQQIAFLKRLYEWRLRDILRRAKAAKNIKHEVTIVNREDEEYEIEAPQVKDEAEIRDAIQLVKSKIGFLPRADQEYFRRHIDGETPAQIARTEGLTMEYVRKRIAQGVRTIRDRIKNSEGEEP